MPFTVSHLAAVLPLRSGRTRIDALPTAPLVIGAMVPDLPAVLGAADLRPATHTGPFALPIDLALTAVLWWGWVVAVRPAVVSTFPEVAARWRSTPARRPVAVWWVVAAVIGAVTHLLWDAFTHSSEGTTWFGGFATHQGLFLGLQLGSSVVGLAVLAVWVRRWWLGTAAAVPAAGLSRSRPQVVGAVVVALGALAGALWRWEHPAAGALTPQTPSGTVGEAAFGALAGVLLAVVLLTASFWAQRWRRRASDDTVPDPTSERVSS